MRRHEMLGELRRSLRGHTHTTSVHQVASCLLRARVEGCKKQWVRGMEIYSFELSFEEPEEVRQMTRAGKARSCSNAELHSLEVIDNSLTRGGATAYRGVNYADHIAMATRPWLNSTLL